MKAIEAEVGGEAARSRRHLVHRGCGRVVALPRACLGTEQGSADLAALREVARSRTWPSCSAVLDEVGNKAFAERVIEADRHGAAGPGARTPRVAEGTGTPCAAGRRHGGGLPRREDPVVPHRTSTTCRCWSRSSAPDETCGRRRSSTVEARSGSARRRASSRARIRRDASDRGLGPGRRESSWAIFVRDAGKVVAGISGLDAGATALRAAEPVGSIPRLRGQRARERDCWPRPRRRRQPSGCSQTVHLEPLTF